MFVDLCRLSGIVSIMFCGMFMAKYVRPNLSRMTDDRVGAFFRVIASLAEIFVFVYIGCALFTTDQAWDRVATWAFIFWSLAALAASRYLNVYPCTAFINVLRPAEQRIPETHKHMLWFSGLRGAMAFALAMLSNKDRPGPASSVILTSTFFMVRSDSPPGGMICVALVALYSSDMAASSLPQAAQEGMAQATCRF
jgi:solute carrier family 9 (sodium/hydrogen exchanger), member 8